MTKITESFKLKYDNIFAKLMNISVDELHFDKLKLNESICANDNAWQKHVTPDSICKQMVDLYSFNESDKILVLFNLELIKELISRKIKKENIYFVSDYHTKSDFLSKYFKEINYINLSEYTLNDLEEKIKSFNVKKFDVVFSNPPYEKNLHLKILYLIRQYSNSQVFIHPDNWLTNPFRKYEKESWKKNAVEYFGKYIKNIKLITAENFNKLFNTSNWFGVGIFLYEKNETNFDINQYLSKNKILLKILDKIFLIPSLRSFYKSKNEWKNKNNVLLMRRTTHGYLKWYDNSNNNKITQGIELNSNIEKINFQKSLDTWLYSYLNKCEWSDGSNSASVPFFINEINPRTNKKGYLSEWTNEDFYNFFNLSNEEIKEVTKKYIYLDE